MNKILRRMIIFLVLYLTLGILLAHFKIPFFSLSGQGLQSYINWPFYFILASSFILGPIGLIIYSIIDIALLYLLGGLTKYLDTFLFSKRQTSKKITGSKLISRITLVSFVLYFVSGLLLLEIILPIISIVFRLRSTQFFYSILLKGLIWPYYAFVYLKYENVMGVIAYITIIIGISFLLYGLVKIIKRNLSGS